MLIEQMSETDRQVVVNAARKNLADLSAVLGCKKAPSAVAARREAAWVFRVIHGYQYNVIGAILGIDESTACQAYMTHARQLEPTV